MLWLARFRKLSDEPLTVFLILLDNFAELLAQLALPKTDGELAHFLETHRHQAIFLDMLVLRHLNHLESVGKGLIRHEFLRWRVGHEQGRTVEHWPNCWSCDMSHVSGFQWLLPCDTSHESQWHVPAANFAPVNLGLPDMKKCGLQPPLIFQASFVSEAVSVRQDHKSPTGRAFFPTAVEAVHSLTSGIGCFDCWCR